jgi:hypothetical protein
VPICALSLPFLLKVAVWWRALGIGKAVTDEDAGRILMKNPHMKCINWKISEFRASISTLWLEAEVIGVFKFPVPSGEGYREETPRFGAS